MNENIKFISYPNVRFEEYTISNSGEIFDVINNKKVIPHEDRDGYLRVCLRIIPVTRINPNGSTKTILTRTFGVHRLVAYEFCELKPDCKVVNHLDGNKKNNFYQNLEWTTALENTRHALRTGLQCNSGPNCPSAVYDESVVRDICKKLENHTPVIDIYYDYHPNDKGHKITDRAFYQLIYSIMIGYRHRTISCEYNIDRSKCDSPLKPRFPKEEVDQIDALILEGKTSTEIMKHFGFKNIHDSSRYSDKIRLERKRLQRLNGVSSTR